MTAVTGNTVPVYCGEGHLFDVPFGDAKLFIILRLLVLNRTRFLKNRLQVFVHSSAFLWMSSLDIHGWGDRDPQEFELSFKHASLTGVAI